MAAYVRRTVGILFFAFIFATGAWAQSAADLIKSAASPDTNDHTSRVQQVNAGTIGVISGSITGTYSRIAADLSAVLDDGTLRVLPILGKGSIQNITDILYLRGVDVGIVQSDVLQYIRDQGLYSDIGSRITYITKLYNEEVHLVSREDIKSVAELQGKKVNFANEGSGTYMTALVIFNLLGINAEITTYDYELALSKLKSGEIDAMFYVAGKPAPIFAAIKPGEGLHLLPIEFTAELEKTYLPGDFSNTDYPGLVPNGEQVSTVAVGAIMAVFNWRKGNGRYYKLKRFVETFFTKFDEFAKEPRHPKWREVNLATEVPGWQRFEPAQKWLDAQTRLSSDQSTQVEQFKSFLSDAANIQGLSAKDQEDLFKKFLKWKESRSQ